MKDCLCFHAIDYRPVQFIYFIIFIEYKIMNKNLLI